MNGRRPGTESSQGGVARAALDNKKQLAVPLTESVFVGQAHMRQHQDRAHSPLRQPRRL